MLVQGEVEPLTAGLLVVGLGSLLSICLYIFFKKSPTDMGGDGMSPVKIHAYGKKTRRFALVGLFAVTILIVLSGGGWHYQQSRLENVVVVLVADFKNLQSQNRGVTETIISQLRDATAEYEDVKIKALNEPITEQAGSEVARSKGEKHYADIVLWGWYNETKTNAKVTVNFEILENLRGLSERQQKSLIKPIAELESFKLQTQVSKEMSYLTLLTLGLIRSEAEDYDSAIEGLTKALEVASDAELETAEDDAALDALYFYRGRAYHDKGTSYQITGYDKTIEGFTYSIPDSNRENGHIENEELERAIDDYSQVLKIDPDSANAYINRGYAHYEKGELDKAIADYTKAIKINPDDALPYNNRGLVYSEKGELERAIADYNRALKINPEYALPYNNRGLAYADKGELERAIADYNQALKINPKYADAYISRGNIYYEKGELERAIADYSQALKINPEYAGAYYNRGLAYAEKGELERAIADYTKVLQINPEYAFAYNNRGWTYYKKGELEKALNDINKALAIDDEYANAYYRRGAVYAEQGERKKAIEDFNKALEFDIEHAYSYYDRGKAYAKLGNKQKAIKDLQQAANLFSEQGETAEHQKALELLNQLSLES